MIQFTTPTITIRVQGVDITTYDVDVSLRQTIRKYESVHTVDIGGADVAMTLDGSDTLVTVSLSQEQTGGFVEGPVDVQVNYGSGNLRMATNVVTVQMGRNLYDQTLGFDVSADPDTSADVYATVDGVVVYATVADGTITAAKLDPSLLSAAYVGNHGANEKTAGLDWQAIIDEVASVSDTIDFGSGVWYVDDPVTLPANVSCVTGSGCTITTQTAQTHFIKITGHRLVTVTGITFDGLGYVGKHIHATITNPATVTNCKFLNIGDGNYGICCDDDVIGLTVIGCVFLGDVNYWGGTCIKAHTDNIVVGCKAFQFDVFLCCSGAIVTGCYLWASHRADGIAFAPEKYSDGTVTGSFADLSVTACEFDCMRAIVINPSNVSISNCLFYWNDTDLTDGATCYVFLHVTSSFSYLSSLSFHDNIVKTQILSYDVCTFGMGGTCTTSNIRRFTSSGNVYATNYTSSAVPEHYKLLIGASFTKTISNQQPVIRTHVAKVTGNTSTVAANFTLKSVADQYTYKRINGARLLYRDNNVVDSSTLSYLACYHAESNDHDIEAYLSGIPAGVSEVSVVNAPAFNLEPLASSKDTTGLTKATTRYIALTNA